MAEITQPQTEIIPDSQKPEIIEPAPDAPVAELAPDAPTPRPIEITVTPRVVQPAEMPDENDDFSQDLEMTAQSRAGDAALAEVKAMMAGEGGTPTEAPTADTEQPQQTPPQESMGKTAEKIGLDMARGVGEAPTQIVGGMRDATQEVIDLAGELANFTPPKLPEVSAATSTTGGAIRGISQFLTGFVGAGKILKPIKVGGAVATAAKTMAQGAIADFSVFDGHDKRFSDLVGEYTDFFKPVTDVLKSDPNDTEFEGRLKNAVEGLGLGVLGDAFFKAAKFISVGRLAKGTEVYVDKVGKFMGDNKPKTLKEQKLEAFASLGDPDVEEVFITRPGAEKIDAAQQATEGMSPSDVRGKAKEGDQVFINFATIDSPEKIKTTMQKMADANKGQIDEAARGKRTWADTKLSAEQEDAWKVLMERRKGQAMNAEQSVAARQLWAASAAKLRELADVAAKSSNPTDLFNFRKMLVTHSAIQAEVIAARTETARALNAWKIPVGEQSEAIGQSVIDALEASGGQELAREMAQKLQLLSAAGAEKAMSNFAERGAMALTRDAFAKYYINALLTNPVTHVSNMLSNFVVAAQQIYERKGAEFIAQKLGPDAEVALGESSAMLHAMLETFKDGYNALSQTVKSGPAEMASKAKDLVWKDAEDMGPAFKKQDIPVQPTDAEAFGYTSESVVGQAINVIDHAVETSGRLLAKQDNVFKSLGYRMELHAQAVRMATQELNAGTITKDLFKQRVAQIIENPPKTVQMEAVSAATYNTFQQKPAEMLKGIGDAIHKVPVLGRLVLPFKTTPINILTYTFERTPLAPFVKQFRNDIRAGGAKKEVAMARMATGTMILAAIVDATIKGQVTGKGPTGVGGQKDNWERRGGQPYSFNVGDTKISFGRVDPIGFTFGIAADYAEAIMNAQGEIDDAEFDKAAAAITFTIANNVMSKTYMRGVMSIIKAISDPDRNALPYISSTIASFIPAGVGAVTRQVDPYRRTAEGVVDTFRRKIPGLSDDLPLYRNLWGEPTDFRSGLGEEFDMISPAYIKTKKPLPIDDELNRLEYFPDMPDRKVSFNDPYDSAGRGGVVLQLSGHQYSRWMELAGNELKHPATERGLRDFLNDVVTGKDEDYSESYKGFSDGPDGGKKLFISKWISKYRELAKRQLLEEDGDLKAQYGVKKNKKPGKYTDSM